MEVQGKGARPDGGAVVQLDTVRALHQTVVSLRAALEASKLELIDLRQKYESHLDAAVTSNVSEKLTLENLNTDNVGTNQDNNNIVVKTRDLDPDRCSIQSDIGKNPEVSENIGEIRQDLNIKEVIKDDEDDAVPEIGCETLGIENANISTGDSKSDNDSLITVLEKKEEVVKKLRFAEDTPKEEKKKLKDSAENKSGEYETKIELESKFDVTIKVLAGHDKTNNAHPIEIVSSDCNSVNLKSDIIPIGKPGDKLSDFDHKNYMNKNTDSIKISIESNEESDMAGSRENSNIVTKSGDKFNIHVKITSEENLTMDQPADHESASEHLNVETDEISARSFSEGDNSVFSEAAETLTGNLEGARRICEQDSISGNDSEEVDDIELIFTTDETKEFTGYQEDLVSITDGESWNPDDPSTPVLVKFNVLDPDKPLYKMKTTSVSTETTDHFDNENLENNTVQEDLSDAGYNRNEVAEESESRDKVESNRFEYKRGFLRSLSNKQNSKESKLDKNNFESTDSLTYDNQKSYSFDNTKSSSLDRGSSIDIVTRELSFDQKEESLDQLDALRTTTRTKYSVCIETDISKCGVMEDDTFPTNLYLRRNTCPNPFQYRPMSHRDAVKGLPSRPLLGTTSQKAPRRSSAAQTDISALPNHWRSETHLTKKVLPHGFTTLPSKITARGIKTSHLTPPAPVRPNRLSEENRRILLSDIGFTSMVPELSRSAEPIWGALGMPVQTPATSITHLPLCCAHHATPFYGSVPSSPTRQDSSNTNSKYWSKNSIQRSISGRMGETTPGSQRVSFIDQPMRGGWRGSLPELRKSFTCCSRAGHRYRKAGQFSLKSRSKTVEAGDSGDSTEELLDEADFFLRSSIDCMSSSKHFQADEFHPTNASRPYLPTVPRQLRLGHLVKVIAPHGRIAVGKVRYVGIAGGPTASGAPAGTYVGIQLKNKISIGGDGSFHGRKYFHCEPGCSIFVPFSKIVVAWANI